MEEIMQHHETGEDMIRGVYPHTFTYKGISRTIDLPGWYTKDGKDGIHSQEDLKVWNKAMKEIHEEYDRTHSKES